MTPAFDDYVQIISTLFDEFVQTEPVELNYQNLNTYSNLSIIIFFMMMQMRQITTFKAQHRWLKAVPERSQSLGWETVPDRTTLSRRYKKLGAVVSAFVAFVGTAVTELGDPFSNTELVEDKSLFKAKGPVWHQSDRHAGRVSKGLRHLDKDATWSKSDYHGWVYGYGLHLTSSAHTFPKLVQIETASVPESTVIDNKAEAIMSQLQPERLTADDGYSKASRIRDWAEQGVCLITPALRWVVGQAAENYHRFLEEDDIRASLQGRKTSIEPLFDLIAKMIGAIDNHKQLKVQQMANVRTCLALGTFSVQIAMIVNSIWGRPLRNISHIMAVFA